VQTPDCSGKSTTAERAIGLSLAAGVGQLLIKVTALLVTGSAAVFADAAESAVHLIAVSFAFFSFRVSRRPPDQDHPYGHGKIGFFSAGVEGGVIFLAALYILGESIRRILVGPTVEEIGWGIGLILLTVAINGVLGWWLIRTGHREHHLILVANGWHVLTDAWTSVGVVVGLVLTATTGWVYWDPVCAILVAVHILRTGSKLIHLGFTGLMDQTSPADLRLARDILQRELLDTGVYYHALRLRNLGDRLAIDLHLLFDDQMCIREAHDFATRIERSLSIGFAPPAAVMTHLEPRRDHGRIHPSSEEKPDPPADKKADG
jgi:cation diffusion facilitator family transporter